MRRAWQISVCTLHPMSMPTASVSLQITANVSGGHLNPAVGDHLAVSTCGAACSKVWPATDGHTLRVGDLCNDDNGEAIRVTSHSMYRILLFMPTVGTQCDCMLTSC